MTLYGYQKNVVGASATSKLWSGTFCDAGNTYAMFVGHSGSNVVTITDSNNNTWVKSADTFTASTPATGQQLLDLWVCVATAPIVAITGTSVGGTATYFIFEGIDFAGSMSVRATAKASGAVVASASLVSAVIGDSLITGAGYNSSVAGTRDDTVSGWTSPGFNSVSVIVNAVWQKTATTTASQGPSWAIGHSAGLITVALYPTPVVPPTLTGTVLASDDFTGTNAAAPAAQWTVTLAGTTPGTAQIQSNKVVLTPGVGTYSTAVTSMWLTGAPAVTNTDWDIMVTMSPDSTLRQHYMVLGMSTNGSIRSGDTLPGNGYGLMIFPSSGGYSLNRVTSGSVVNLMGANGAYTFVAGTAVNVRIKMSGGNTLTLWMWNAGTNMPTTPTWTGTDTAPLTGTLKPILSASNGAATTAIPATFDDFSFASTAATQGFFVYNGTVWVHHVANVRTATPAWVAAPASETT